MTDLIALVDSLQIRHAELILDFHTRMLEIQNQIQKQQDLTGQSNRLTRRFCRLLFEKQEYKHILLTIQTELKNS